MIKAKTTQEIFANISTASFEAVRILRTNAKQCFSVCLYKEPLYKQIHPKRDFKERYLDTADSIRNFLNDKGFHIHIFADEEMLNTALGLNLGSVFVVKQRPLYPFFQHLYRYYSVFLNHPSIETYHFRGLDNIVATDEAFNNLIEFHNSGLDVLNMPYYRKLTEAYCPIRGSLSVSKKGITSLANFLKVNRLYPNLDNKRLLWHTDEDFLSIWFNQIKNHLGVFTILDREMPMDFYFNLFEMLKHNNNFTIKRTGRGDI